MNFEHFRSIIQEKIPEGTVIPRHTETGHFYEVPRLGKTFPSVTGKLQVLKEQGLTNWKMNRALDYVFAHWNEFTETNVMDHLTKAKLAPVKEFEEAGDIGTEIHRYRELYFRGLIAGSAKRPEEYIEEVHKDDIRFNSAMGALEKFVYDWHYRPIATELYVYSEKLGLAGTLDDIGLVRYVEEEGNRDCKHLHVIDREKYNRRYCMQCKYKAQDRLVLLDLKSSNQFKDHYFLQVALYWGMFVELVGIKPTINIILKLDKNNRTYKVEEMKDMRRLYANGKRVVAICGGLEFIKSIRKDNQKNVVTI